MKFRKIDFYDHPIFGSISFDFTDATGKTVDTIILAGENGCGKSLLLSFLNQYNPGVSAKELGYRLCVEVEISDEDVKALKENRDTSRVLGSSFTGNVLRFVHDTSSQDDLSRVRFLDIEGKEHEGYAYLFSNVSKFYKTVFSDVEINFTPGVINHTTSNSLDKEISRSEKSSHHLATEIKQLLIDINELDNEELAQWVDTHPGQVPISEVLHRRIRRFTKAFNKIFPHKRLIGIDNQNDQKRVIFEEHGKRMEISELSSGEKQIVFRGGFLLRNLGTLKGAPVLVDEPELSLHPQWQLEILNFLKGLFTDEKGIQTSQLIVATHSPFILHNDTRANDKVLVLQKDGRGIITVLDKPEFYSWSESTAVEDAFSVLPLLTKDRIVVFLEGETDEAYFRKAVEVFGYDANKISFNWIGHYIGGNKGKAENTGDTALNSAAAFLRANPMMMQLCKVYLLYDCDTNKPSSQDGNLYIGAMAKNDHATNYQIGVENLLVLPADFDYSKFYSTSSQKNKYGGVNMITNLDKTALSQYIIGLPESELEGIFINLRNEIETILRRTR